MKNLRRVRESLAIVRTCIRDRQGSVSVFYALTFVVLIGFAAISIDGSRAHLLRSQLSFAADIASLAVSHEAPSLTDAELTAAARMYVVANLTPSFLGATAITAENLTVNARVGDLPNTVEVEVIASLNTALLGIIDGRLSVVLTANSVAQRQAKPGEVILVLDATGSMNSKIVPTGLKKIDTMTLAVNDMFDIFYGERETVDDFYVGIVPAKGFVSIKPHDEWVAAEDWVDPFGDWLDTQHIVFRAGKDETDINTNWADLTGETWCAGVRDFETATWGIDDTPPDVAPIELYIDFQRRDNGVGYEFFIQEGDCDNDSVMPLTAARTPLFNKVSSLKPRGPQRSDLAVAWGWREFSPEWRGLWGNPSLPMDYNNDVGDKTMVMMISALNNFGPGEDADGHLVAQCSEMKQNGVIIYTVPWDLPPNALWLYEECASGPSYFYPAATNEELREAFVAIGSKISGLKLIE